jgi:hypothetical protein
MNLKGYGRKQIWPNPEISLEGLWKTILRTVSQLRFEPDTFKIQDSRSVTA